MRKNYKEQLASYVDALYPIIYINHFDFKEMDDLIAEIAQGGKILEFNHGVGAVKFETKRPIESLEKHSDLLEFLKDAAFFDKEEDIKMKSRFIILKDVHNQLNDPEVISMLKMIAERHMYREDYSATVFIVSSKLVIPEELENYITVFDIPVPDQKEIDDIIESFCEEQGTTISEELKSDFSISFRGLNKFQINQILTRAYQDGGNLIPEDRELILSQKEQLIKKSGLLEMITVKESIDDIGGLDNLKNWLDKKAKVFEQLDKAMKYGVDIPKGTMIVGMPGCGKSLAAKATASLFDLPLVRLDVGRLLGKYIGESEENMRGALKLAEAISPCVLWIDELEKAFSGVGQSSGAGDVTTRLFGQFLTWMQEKENTVFIVATGNDISKIPPEFLRKGRFDELFSVDFPKPEERRKIIEIHLKKRNKWNKQDISALVTGTDGYSGADLEAIVKEAVETCFIEGKKEVTIEDLLAAKKNTNSISVALKDRIEKIKESMKNMDLKPASKVTKK